MQVGCNTWLGYALPMNVDSFVFMPSLNSVSCITYTLVSTNEFIQYSFSYSSSSIRTFTILLNELKMFISFLHQIFSP